MKMPRKRLRRFDLQKAAFILPNLFTLSSIFCGFYAAVTAAAVVPGQERETLYRACVAVLFSMIFDAVDGRVARLTRTQSEFGVQMDSLADVISFGATPALIAWHWGLNGFGTAGLLACFVYCACAVVRLARFNVLAAHSTGPSNYFIGLPTPAAAGLLVAIIIATINRDSMPTESQLWPPYLLVLLGFFMVSNIRFPTFKATRMTKSVFAAIASLFGALLVVGIQVGPSIAIIALMGAYLLYGTGHTIWRYFKPPNDPDGLDDGEDVLHEPVNEFDDYEEELID